MFTDGEIRGVLIRDLKKHHDQRGWLVELFRADELDEPFLPVMCYLSMTESGIARGPHEHRDQADNFCFFGPSTFKIYMWDTRRDSTTYMKRQILLAGADRPLSIIIPAGVVHAYRNVGNEPGMVVNCPNRLYAGKEKKEPVDEIRHEHDPDTIFRLD